MESLPQAVIQAGAIVFKSAVSNNEQCFYDKNTLEDFISQAFFRDYAQSYSKYLTVSNISSSFHSNRRVTRTSTTDEQQQK